ncbi:IPT/TIG domain-containing protein [Hymenobacter terricola]|uniref:IPT/TIG domain-containing protein n=1 Tax=Hymenobacter terricola TaxID=2819236 RepID=UPI001B315F87|nr:IPT/TIG domain-containing protein [Hymenobacter terricola]
MKICYHCPPATQRLATNSSFGKKLGRIGAALLLTWGTTLGAKAQQSAPQFFQANAEARTAAAASPLSEALFHSQALTLDVAALRAALATAPLETRANAVPLVLALPLPNGSTGRFAVREAPVMAPALAAQFPDIKTYAGVGLDDASASVRLDITQLGFHAQVLTGNGNSFYIDPVTRTDARHYLEFYRKDMNRAAAGTPPSCGFVATAADAKATALRLATAARTSGSTAALLSGPQLRTYRLALACTPEYAVTKGNTVASVMAGEVATVNRVVGVYEKELAVRMVLVANNNQLIFLRGIGTQPSPVFDDSNTNNVLLSQNQSNIDRIIGTANYDIGHVVSTGGGGVASLGAVCSSTRKAQGVTGLPNPVGDAFDIDFVAHEMGHQFAGNHPFNGTGGNCGGGNRNASTAWEPGSGSTIMAYAGICGSANDLQPHSDPIFHTGNYQEMQAFIATTTCGTTTATGNTAPVVTAPASGKTLPISTPFKLTASATDAENDPLTYMWEELDLGPAGSPTAAQAANDTPPLFRSFVPSFDATRYFPRLTDLVNNTTVLGERLPTVTRTLKFRCTARDTHSGAAGVIGGVDYSALVNLSVSSTAGPFLVTAPNTAVSWTGGAAQTVTWDVAGTDVAPVSCATVNLRLSLDGGLTYPVLLAANVPNNGTAAVNAPNVTTAQARVMVESADNYFFDVSNANFTIAPGPGPAITSFTPASGPAGTAVTITGTNFTGATAVSFNGTAATFTVSSATSIIATVAAGSSTGLIAVTTPAGTAVSATPFLVGSPPTITSFTPTTGPIGNTVVITGTNFTAATQVAFNGTGALAFSINSATQITVTVPVGATTGPIAVTTPLGTGTSATDFTVPPVPIITSFTPTSGLPGTVVVLTGNYFTGATQVTFNGTVAPGFVVNSATQITVTVPAGTTSGLITVTAPNGVGVSTTPFVILVPVISSFTPTTGPVGTVVVLTGNYFTGATQVTFNGTVAPGFVVNSATQITVTVPAGTTSGFITVTSVGGTGTSAVAFLLPIPNDFCANAIALTCGQNVSGSTLGATDTGDPTGSCTETVDAGGVFYSLVGTGASITVATCNAGTNFDTKLFVYSGPCGAYVCVAGNDDVNCGAAQYASAVTFASVYGTRYLVFVTGYQTSAGNFVLSTNCATPPPAPIITSLNPTSGPALTSVTITGSNFTAATAATLNGLAVTNFTVVNDNTITFTVPATATTGDVVVTTAGGIPSNGVLFTVTVVSATAKANQSGFSVWPNPVAGKGTMHISLTASASKASVTLRNVLGQTVGTRTFSGTTTELPTTSLASGTYLLTVQMDGRAPSIQRVVVE